MGTLLFGDTEGLLNSLNKPPSKYLDFGSGNQCKSMLLEHP